MEAGGKVFYSWWHCLESRQLPRGERPSGAAQLTARPEQPLLPPQGPQPVSPASQAGGALHPPASWRAHQSALAALLEVCIRPMASEEEGVRWRRGPSWEPSEVGAGAAFGAQVASLGHQHSASHLPSFYQIIKVYEITRVWTRFWICDANCRMKMRPGVLCVIQRFP